MKQGDATLIYRGAVPEATSDNTRYDGMLTLHDVP